MGFIYNFLFECKNLLHTNLFVRNNKLVFFSLFRMKNKYVSDDIPFILN